MTAGGAEGGAEILRVGVLGGGQLGRMLALAGIPLGIRFRFLEPNPDPPVRGLGEVVRARYDDEAALDRFVDGLDAVTYEFENVPVEAVRRIAARVPVRPPPAALDAAQDRWTEKETFREAGIRVAPSLPVEGRASLDAAVDELGLPAVLKTRRMGYDGKGQAVLREPADIEPAWERLGGRPLILERFIDFRRELSCLAVRSLSGEIAAYPLVENAHREGILRESRAPSPGLTGALQEEGERIAATLMESLGYVGVLAVELFETGEGLVANEMAPRVHNSGHWTQDGAETSQFENHLRAVLDLPLGPTAPLDHAGMVNLIGGIPERARLLHLPGTFLHLYDKEVRPGRKVGHVNVRGASPEERDRRLAAVREPALRAGRG